MIKWVLTPVVGYPLPMSEGGGLRRTPMVCLGDKYPCAEWSAVFSINALFALVRYDIDSQVTFESSGHIEELTTPEQWFTLYESYPEFKNRWSDQP